MQKTLAFMISLCVLALLSSLFVASESTAQEDTSGSKAAAAKVVAGAAAPRGMAVPEYDAQGALLRPVGFERWMVVGTSIGLSYSDGKANNPDDPGQFHNVYMQPEAFDHYVRTGEFPEQTIFVVTNNPSTSTKGKDSLNRNGFFAAPSTGLEVAVRDSKRFPDVWAYYMYHDTDQKFASGNTDHGENDRPLKSRSAELPYPRSRACYDCHAEHGAVDNVFTQFYSVLSHARAEHVAENQTGTR
jgi:hypothetical protein